MSLNRLPIESLNQFVDDLMRNSSARNPAWNVEHLKKQTKNEWNYVDGCMMLAFLELYKTSGDEKFLSYIDRFMDFFVMEDGTIRTYGADNFCLDNINEAKILFPLFELTKKEKYRRAITIVFENLIKMPRTNKGNFWHKKIYQNQVWLDGLYMAMPFYMEYETRYHDMRNYYDIYSQFMNVQKLMRDKETGLYYHGYDESRCAPWSNRATGCSRSFWLRSIGWLVMALTDTLEQMDEQLYYEYCKLCSMLKDLVDALLPYQDKCGMFYQVVNRPADPENYLETSGTCMISCSILKAVRLRLISERYAAFGEKAFYGTFRKYFSAEMGEQAALGGICLVAGLGGLQNRDGSPSYYYSEPITENEGKGVAPFLLAYAEISRRPASTETFFQPQILVEPIVDHTDGNQYV
jgi:unsaturated rhamnogalacturonyl hydrolase